MKKLKINSQKHGKLERKFETQGELDLYLETIGDHWGKSEWIELIPEVMDDAGNTLEPAKQIIHPAEYTYEIIDITNEYQKELDIEKRKETREKCLRILDEIAAYNMTVNQELQSIFSSPTFVQIILALSTGAPKSAAYGIRAVGPQVYPQAMVDDIATRLEAL